MSRAMIVAASLALANVSSLSAAAWQIRPIDDRGEPLEDVEVRLDPAHNLETGLQPNATSLTFRNSEALIVAATIRLEGSRGYYLPLPVHLLGATIPREKICAYREFYPASVRVPADRTVSYIRDTFASYSGFDGDVEETSIRYQILSAIVKERLDDIRDSGRPPLSADIKAVYNFLQVSRDLGRANCVRPTGTVKRAARFLGQLADHDIRLLNGALTGHPDRSRAADIKKLLEQVEFVEVLHFHALWRGIIRRGVGPTNCPNYAALRNSLTSGLQSGQLIAMENHAGYRLIALIEPVLEICAKTEVYYAKRESGVLNEEAWKKISKIYAPTDVPGMGGLTAERIEKHKTTMAILESQVS